MRLFFDCRYVRTDHHDGISRYSAELVRALSELHPVTMLIHDEAQLPMLPELPWLRVAAPTSPLEPLLARQLNRLRPDVVFSPMQTMGSVARRYGLILTVHDLIYYQHRTPPRNLSWPLRAGWRLYHLSYWPQRLLLRGADRVATISETSRRLIAEHRLSRPPVVIVANAPDPAFSLPEPAAAPPAEPNLVYMGSFMPYKNVETLALALRELPGWRLHLCSRVDAPTLRRLRGLAPKDSIVAHQGVSDEEYRRLLAGATALVTASRSEGFGLPLVEAMAAGTPVICSSIPIFREVGGPAALYADPDAPAEFAAAAHQLADPERWLARAEAGRRQAAGYSWRASAEALLEACHAVHAERTAAPTKA